MDIKLIQPPFTDEFEAQYVSVAAAVFGDSADDEWLDTLRWRLNHMPDVTVFVAYDGERIMGFKAGYAQTYDRYYSWLGGTHPEYRGRGGVG